MKTYTCKYSLGLTLICLSGLSGILAPLFFITVMLIVESLQPAYNPWHDTISWLVRGYYGWFQTLSFFVFGLLMAVFTLRLYTVMKRKATSVLGALFLLLSSLGFFSLGAFPVERGQTLPALLHRFAAIDVGLFFILGCLALAAYFRKDGQWEKLWTYTAITAIMSLSFFLIWILTPPEWQLKGLSQRLLLASGFLWLEIISIKLLGSCLRNRGQVPPSINGATLGPPAT